MRAVGQQRFHWLPATRTGRINKFRAGMYITELDRVFEVAGGRATLRGRPCPTSAVRGGCIYLLEPALLGAAEDFHRR